jgi:2-dehydro-3-deoxyphosphogluconate aldolase/(4S)-4-hydroxy-2-oxoglutarate aldolase
MASQALADRIGGMGVVPVIAIADEGNALSLGDALLEGGLPIAEITFRTKAAARTIEILAGERPQISVGAGTVLTAADLQSAKAAGAGFAFAPGLNPDIVKQAQDMGLDFIPGIATPSELEQALRLNCTIVKFFPAESLGGLDMLSAMSAPYRHTGIKVVPTGGVKPSSLEAYLKNPLVLGVGGSWIASTEDISAGKWSEIANRCREAAATVRRIRPI